MPAPIPYSINLKTVNKLFDGPVTHTWFLYDLVVCVCKVVHLVLDESSITVYPCCPGLAYLQRTLCQFNTYMLGTVLSMTYVNYPKSLKDRSSQYNYVHY